VLHRFEPEANCLDSAKKSKEILLNRDSS
jgi:hypothetical protein